MGQIEKLSRTKKKDNDILYMYTKFHKCTCNNKNLGENAHETVLLSVGLSESNVEKSLKVHAVIVKSLD